MRSIRAVCSRPLMMEFCAVRTRSTTPVAWIRRRISGRIMNIGVWNALSSRNFTASACLALGTVANRTPCWPMCFCCDVNPPTRRDDVVHLGRPLADHAAVDLFQLAPRIAHLGAGRGEQHLRDAAPGSSRRAPSRATASPSPTASVLSPGSLPPGPRSRSAGTASCPAPAPTCRASASRPPSVLAPGIGL